MAKQIAVVIPGATSDAPTTIKDVSLEAGTTVADVLQSAGLKGYFLKSSQSGQFLSPRDNLFTAAQEGEKFFAVPQMEVGICSMYYRFF